MSKQILLLLALPYRTVCTGTIYFYFLVTSTTNVRTWQVSGTKVKNNLAFFGLYWYGTDTYRSSVEGS